MGVKFSVCIPTHRVDFRLHNALRSVVHQDFNRSDIELCVFANGPIERDLRTIIADRIEHVTENLGPSEAKNRALSMGTADWLILLDSDDYLVPSALKQYEAEIAAHHDMVLGAEFSAVNIIRQPDGIGLFFHSDSTEFERFFKTNIESVPETAACGRPIIFRRSERLPYDTRFSYAEERRLCLDYWNAGHTIQIMKTCSYVYNWSSEGLTKGKTTQQMPEFAGVTERLAEEARVTKARYAVSETLRLTSAPDQQDLLRILMLEKYFDKENHR